MTDDFQMTETEVQSLVGLSVDEARSQVQARGGVLRVRAEDGESFMVTADFRTDRVDVWVEVGRIASAKIG